MNLERYPVKTIDDFKTFEFWSEGPKGRIRKIVKYETFDYFGRFNVMLGDWDEKTRIARDNVRSNNNDKDKVMATVAATVFQFMEYHPGAIIRAYGESAAKTRLYQMGINRHLFEIRNRFVIRGLFNNIWEHFESGKNYDAFELIGKREIY